MNNNPFTGRPYAAADEILRRGRERAELIKRALGPTFTMQDRFKSMLSPLGQLARLQRSGLFNEFERARKLHSDRFKFLNYLMSPHRFSAVQEASKALQQFDDGGVSERLRLLSSKFDSGIFATARKLEGRDNILASAFASKWQDQRKSLYDQIFLNLSALRTVAERALMLEQATLRASEQHHATATQFIAEQAVEAQRIAEALVQADAPDESARLFIAFVGTIAAIFDHFKGNTIEELRKVGLLGLLLIAMTIIALPQLQPDPEMSSEERQQYAELRSEVLSLKGMIGELVKAESSLNEAFISSLPRGELTRRANIRRAPRRDAPKIMIAEPATLIAIVRSEGRWKEVVFRDPLTDQLLQGWVYGSLVSTLEP